MNVRMFGMSMCLSIQGCALRGSKRKERAKQELSKFGRSTTNKKINKH